MIPQITGVFGTCGGGLALVAGMSDFTFIAEDAKLFVNSPNAIDGNKNKDTAASSFKAESGAADAVASEEEVLGKIRTLVSLLPSNNEDEAVAECTDDLNRACSAIAANAEDASAAVRDLADKDGFASTEDEEKTVARAAAQLAGAFAGATVPKVNVVVNAIGSAYAVMNAKALGADITIALPETKIGIMEGRFAAQILGRDGDDKAALAKEYDELQNSSQNSSASAAARGYVDQISEAADVRKYVIGALEMLYTKREDSAFIKKHGTV